MRFRLTVDDTIEREGLVLVLAHDKVHLLGPVASALVMVWRESAVAEGWVGAADAVAFVERSLGAAPGGDGEAIVREQLNELAASGLVEVDSAG